MSTASPDTCADVPGVATQRAASASEPYLRTASRRSCCWYSAERQPLSTTTPPPSAAAAVAAWRRAPCSSGSRLATPGIPSSKTVVPAGTAPSASPSASRSSLRGVVVDDGEDAIEGERAADGDGTVEDDDTSDVQPRAAAIATVATST